MHPSLEEAHRLIDAFELLAVDSVDRIMACSDLRTEDRGAITAGLTGRILPVALAEQLLDSWDTLSPAERTAALLAIAEALAAS